MFKSKIKKQFFIFVIVISIALIPELARAWSIRHGPKSYLTYDSYYKPSSVCMTELSFDECYSWFYEPNTFWWGYSDSSYNLFTYNNDSTSFSEYYNYDYNSIPNYDYMNSWSELNNYYSSNVWE